MRKNQDKNDKTENGIKTELWRMYQNGINYTASIGLSERIKKNVDFYEGKQWAEPTEATRFMPRPVVNIIRFVCRNKRAMLTSTPIKLVYSCKESPKRADEFTDFAAFICKEMDVSELDSRAIRDALLKGCYFYHFFWEKDKTGRRGIKEGGLSCELIDPLNIFFSNPYEQDEQKQKWILIASRMEKETAEQIADIGTDVSMIFSDAKPSEQGGSELCTVLTRYFRKNGEVFCERATENCVLNKPFSISPYPDDAYKATLYPVVAGEYEEREKCIYGISEVEGLISNQKLINHILGMEALAIQNTAWGKYIVSKDALRGQQISNEPGEVLVDHSIGGNGIRKLEQHVLTGTPVSFVNNLTSMTRTVCGATEVMTGETILGNLSGAAIAQLQSQANQPINEQRKRFFRVKRKFGKVLEQFFRLFYENKIYRNDSKEGEQKCFASSDYKDLEFDIQVEAVGGVNGSSATDIGFLETLYNKGDIDVETYVKAYPSDVLCEKNKYEQLIKEQLEKYAAAANNNMENGNDNSLIPQENNYSIAKK